METSEIRARIRNYIEHADERILRIFNAIIEAEATSFPASHREGSGAPVKHAPKPTEDEKSREEGIGSLKDDHRLK